MQDLFVGREQDGTEGVEAVSIAAFKNGQDVGVAGIKNAEDRFRLGGLVVLEINDKPILLLLVTTVASRDTTIDF